MHLHLPLYLFLFYQEGKGDNEAAKVGNESDVPDFIEQRVDLSLAGLASCTGDDDAASTGDGVKVCVGGCCAAH